MKNPILGLLVGMTLASGSVFAESQKTIMGHLLSTGADQEEVARGQELKDRYYELFEKIYQESGRVTGLICFTGTSSEICQKGAEKVLAVMKDPRVKAKKFTVIKFSDRFENAEVTDSGDHSVTIDGRASVEDIRRQLLSTGADQEEVARGRELKNRYYELYEKINQESGKVTGLICFTGTASEICQKGAEKILAVMKDPRVKAKKFSTIKLLDRFENAEISVSGDHTVMIDANAPIGDIERHILEQKLP